MWGLVFLGLLAGVGAGWMAGCEGKTDTSPYPVHKSGFFAYAATDIYWLDNHRVLFAGRVTGKSEVRVLPPEMPKGQEAAFVWDLEANTIQRFLTGYRTLCFAEDRLRISRERGGERHWFEGWPGEFKALPEVDREMAIGQPEYRWNDLSCTVQKRPESMEGRAWIPLLPEHGYLDWGPRPKGPADEGYQVRYHRRGGSVEKLPFSDNNSRLPLYSEFDDTYYFRTGTPTNEWKETGCYRIWRMRPNGKTQPECLPFHNVGGAMAPFIEPVKRGLVLESNDLRSSTDPGKAGLYLWDGKGYTRLVTGLTYEEAASPNGCRLAYAYRYNSQEKPTLRVLDLCKEKEGENHGQ